MNFIIDKDGNIKNIEFEMTCGDGYIEQEVLRVISKLNKFQPGILNGEKANVKITLPIEFNW